MNPEMNSLMCTLVDEVKAHAYRNYDNKGWDYIVECYTDDEIAAEIGNARTVTGAIRKVGRIVKLMHERREDIQATAW